MQQHPDDCEAWYPTQTASGSCPLSQRAHDETCRPGTRDLAAGPVPPSWAVLAEYALGRVSTQRPTATAGQTSTPIDARGDR